ncbi:hypothetical protein HETIRDRAFT_454793 [Heterobasidion irregulare TC 32-1]|uniref:Uncharacterized protein n=1 Tax=Heterobasidion irregulare (strain TC 32-1) TaxID=747525 RepID=W4JVL2_HETIT|nr:uncharacterized protein HETIRDRAFT_454793 [Heterobasidion irregulare TC 32-1]ETW77519.1 hypothetical protein HETIRDRAFT_454793 [Heterobasidion irregulare TC 32-1]
MDLKTVPTWPPPATPLTSSSRIRRQAPNAPCPAPVLQQDNTRAEAPITGIDTAQLRSWRRTRERGSGHSGVRCSDGTHTLAVPPFFGRRGGLPGDADVSAFIRRAATAPVQVAPESVASQGRSSRAVPRDDGFSNVATRSRDPNVVARYHAGRGAPARGAGDPRQMDLVRVPCLDINPRRAPSPFSGAGARRQRDLRYHLNGGDGDVPSHGPRPAHAQMMPHAAPGRR